MYFALDSEGHRVSIFSASYNPSFRKKNYFCPCCGSPLIPKLGKKITHHFAHKASSCCDTWYRDNKGPWHRDMQSHFPEECCEVRISDPDGSFHIADVFLEGADRNCVIEFQDSYLTPQEFKNRNTFYSLHSCKFDNEGSLIPNDVYWVFNFKSKLLNVNKNYNSFYDDHKSKSNGPQSFMFINTFCDLDEDFLYEPADSNSLCLSRFDGIPCPQIFFHPSLLTQVFREITSSLNAFILWKTPKRHNRMFYNLPSNIHIYFDVVQRCYVTNNSEFHKFNVKKPGEMVFYQYLAEYKKVSFCSYFNDVLAEFLVYIPNKNFYSLEKSLPLFGKVVPYTDFFNKMNTLSNC